MRPDISGTRQSIPTKAEHEREHGVRGVSVDDEVADADGCRCCRARSCRHGLTQRHEQQPADREDDVADGLDRSSPGQGSASAPGALG
jgi:hypothetical protein